MSAEPDSQHVSAATSQRTLGSARAKVAIVMGRGKSLSAQERETLRQRLRAAAIVVLFGFGIYLVRSYFDNRPLQGFHTFVVFSLIVSIAVLVSRLELTTSHLRWLELAIFGVPIVFFVPYHYFCMVQMMEADDPVGIVAIFKNISGYWLVLLVIYGLFIPNNWKRTAVVISPMVILPVATGVVAATVHPRIGEHLNLRELSDTLMLLCVAALCAAYGAEVIRSLRKEARDAQQFGQYRLRERIGKGGMGEVFMAEHQLLKRPCAIKLIRTDHTSDPNALARFEREVRTTAKLTHWNTIDIYDYGRTDDGTFYYVMEFLPGMNLQQALDRSGPFSPARTINVLCQICGALSEAHAAAFVHRDINTGNIFLTKRGGVFDVAKLLDFGLVKTVGKDAGTQTTQLTQMGMVSGTPKFMSPEQATANCEPGIASDLYSLGAVGYMLLSGQAPFEASSVMEIMVALVRDPVRPLRELKRDVPAALEKVIMRCLEKKPEDRFASAHDLREALQAIELEDRWDQQDAANWWKEVDTEIASSEPKHDDNTADALDPTIAFEKQQSTTD